MATSLRACAFCLFPYNKNSVQSSSKIAKMHIDKKYLNLTLFPGVQILLKGGVSGESLKTMRKLCFSTKFPHQEIV